MSIDHEPKEVYPPRGFGIMCRDSLSELASSQIFATMEEARAEAVRRQFILERPIDVVVLGKNHHASWDDGKPISAAEPEASEPQLVWVPNGEGFYARDSLNKGTYHVERLVGPAENPTPWWNVRYEATNGGWASSGVNAAHCIERAQEDNAERVRAAAWADYMRDNDPPTGGRL